MSRGPRLPIAEPTETPDAYGIAWAAGFIEGDGHVGRNSTSPEIDITQKQRWPLERMQALFGGTLGTIHNQGVLRRSYFRWRVTGDRARNLARLVNPYLSPEKKAQVEKLLS